MSFQRLDLPAAHLRSLAWNGDVLIDWVNGYRYPLEGPSERMHVGDPYRFDAAVGLGPWGVSFESLGTKGVLMRDNGRRPQGGIVPLGVDIVREIDRSYYHATDYRFPVTLFHLPDGRPVLAHCPRSYRVLDLDDLDGNCLTPRPVKDAADVFHARLAASLDGRWLLSNGWVWQPWEIVCVYDVTRALAEPAYLSTIGEKLELGDAAGWELEGATFVGNRLVCVTSEESNALVVYDLDAKRLERIVDLQERAGTRLMALDDNHIVLFDGHPRVLDLTTGAIVEQWSDLDGGGGLYQPSVNLKPPTPPCLATDPAHGRFALGWPDRIVVMALRV